MSSGGTSRPTNTAARKATRCCSDRRQFIKPRERITKAGTIIYSASQHDCAGMPDEAAVLPQHADPKDRAQRA